nr:acyltransferase family protein [Faecalicatena faecalis]
MTNLFVNKSVESESAQYWEVAKGITIILMILGHVSIPEYLRRIIYSFHIPLFIITSGYFIKSYDIKRTFTRSIKSLLYPYCVTCVISAVIFAVIGNHGNFYMPFFVHKMKAMLGGMSKISTKFQDFDSVCVVWFLCSLFITRNLYVALMNVIGKYSKTIIIGMAVLIALLGYTLGQYYAFLPWSFDVALVTVPFIMFGDWLRKKQVVDKNYFWTLILPGAIWIYFLKMGIHIELTTRYYPCGIFSFIEAIAGSLVVISVSKMLTKWEKVAKVMSWLGKNSMLILGIHCLELLYMNWNEWVFEYLPFTMNWFRIFVIKSIIIILTAVIVSIIKTWLSRGLQIIRIKAIG